LAVLSLGIKQLEHEADHLPPTSGEVKTSGSHLPLLCSVVFWVVSADHLVHVRLTEQQALLTQSSCTLYN